MGIDVEVELAAIDDTGGRDITAQDDDDDDDEGCSCCVRRGVCMAMARAMLASHLLLAPSRESFLASEDCLSNTSLLSRHRDMQSPATYQSQHITSQYSTVWDRMLREGGI